MIPYFQFTTIELGPITIQVWGVLVASGILIGAWTAARYAARFGINKDLIYRGSFWIIVGSFIGGRLFHVFAYNPSYYLAQPLDILKVWQGGMSVTGGFIGAAVAYLLFSKVAKINWRQYIDKFFYGLPLGLGVGRLGCFFVHDHPGTVSDFFLAVKRPDGLALHDHGLYLSINGFILAIVFYFLAKKPRSDGFFARVFLIWYGIVRFFLDFWRIIDVTYAGLTPAQYASLLMIVGGLFWWFMERKGRLDKAGKI